MKVYLKFLITIKIKISVSQILSLVDLKSLSLKNFV